MRLELNWAIGMKDIIFFKQEDRYVNLDSFIVYFYCICIHLSILLCCKDNRFLQFYQILVLFLLFVLRSVSVS